MDVSNVFRASVKTAKLREKIADDVDLKSFPRKPLGTRDSFYAKARAVVTQISELREFLMDNRSAYLNFSGLLASRGRMSDEERDQIDYGAQKIMGACAQMIKELKRDIAASEISPQNSEHREIMTLLIEDYLKRVCRIYSEQKAMRVKRAMEMRKMGKLEAEPKIRRDSSSLGRDRSKLNATNDGNVDGRDRFAVGSTESSPLKVQELNGDVNAASSYDDELSAEDIQMFQSENEQLYNELNTLTEEVKLIESKVVHIAELQEIFTEKVLDQDKDLDRLMTTVVGSTENVKEANEQIRQAIQRNAGLRVWILFFLLVMSFSLLFLDWYNP